MIVAIRACSAESGLGTGYGCGRYRERGRVSNAGIIAGLWNLAPASIGSWRNRSYPLAPVEICTPARVLLLIDCRELRQSCAIYRVHSR